MSTLSKTVLGIDFGTSNSAVSVAVPGESVRLLPLEGGARTMPTALFFNAEDRCTHYGRDAMAQYLAGTEGRLMRSLKSLLGSALLQEQTAIYDGSIRYHEVITRYLQMLAGHARDALGGLPGRVVLGRPVHFVDDDPARDRQAEDALREAAARAGFAQVQFQPEPIAAGLDHERTLARDSLVLVVDIGGGTSDFSVVRLGPGRHAQADRRGDVLATAGVHLGGTDLDRRLSLQAVMPLLGLRHVGPQGREVPSRVFFDLATWHLIPWCYSARALREAQALRTDYTDARLHARLMRVLEQRDGHRLADLVEQTKIAVSQTGAAHTLALDCMERGLQAELTPEAMAEYLREPLAPVVACALDCVRRAGLAPQQLDALYLTGGSSALRPLRTALAAAFAPVPLVEGDLLGGVASGLALTPAPVA